MSKLTHNTTRLSASAVLFAMLVILGIGLTFVSLGGALVLSFGTETQLPHSLIPFFVIIVLVTLLASVFFLAGYIASRVSHQKLLFDSIVHGLATWACLSLMVVVLLCSATAAESIRRSLSHFTIKGTSLLTQIEVLKARAVTTLEPGHEMTKPHIPTPDEQKADWLLIWAWWIGFFSLISGLGASVGGAYVGHKRSGSKESRYYQELT